MKSLLFSKHWSMDRLGTRGISLDLLLVGSTESLKEMFKQSVMSHRQELSLSPSGTDPSRWQGPKQKKATGRTSDLCH